MEITTPSPRDRAVKRTLGVVLVLNLGVTIAKLVVGWLTSSIAMMADGFHSLTDSAANVVGLIAMSVAQRPPDEDHPYGHRRFETLAALIIGALLALTAWEVLKSCVERLREGGAPDATLTSFVVMGTTMVISWVVSTWERREAKRHRSELLHADSEHTRSDMLTSAAVLGSLVGARLGYSELDLVAAVLITLIIGRTAFRILKDNTMLLADTAMVSAEQIREVAMEVPGVISVHKIRSRGSALGGHADLHIQVRADLALDIAHEIGHQVSDQIRERFGLPDVLVHVEPPIGYDTGAPTKPSEPTKTAD
jgi:cation diffusion facilitator family transporter